MTTAEQIHNLNMKCRADALFCGKVWLAHYFKNERAAFHYDMINRINNRPKDVNTIVIECARGTAKTALISELLTVHDSVYGGLRFTVITSYADDAAQRIMSRCTDYIKSEHFGVMFPNANIVRGNRQLIEVHDDSENGFDFQIITRGRDSQKTGLRYKECRISRFIGDDMEDPEEAYSQDIVDKNYRYVNEVVEPAMEPGGLMIFIGTPFAHDCLTRRLSEKTHGVMTIRYPILVDDRIGGIFRGRERVGRPMSEILGIPEGHSIWEDRFPTEVVLATRDAKIEDGTSDFGSWLRQFMLDPRPPGEVCFDMDAIKYFLPEEIANKKLNVFILCDYAYSRQMWADESAVVAIGVDDESNYYVLYAEKDKWGEIGTTKKIIEVATRFKDNLRTVGVETRSFQFVQKALLDAKREANLNFGVTELKPKNKSKAERIGALIPLIEDGRWFMRKNQNKLKYEMSRFRGEEMKRGDDLMDSAAYILDVAYKPITVRTKDQVEKEANHLEWQKIVREQNALERERKELDGPRRVHDSHNSVDSFF